MEGIFDNTQTIFYETNRMLMEPMLEKYVHEVILYEEKKIPKVKWDCNRIIPKYVPY